MITNATAPNDSAFNTGAPVSFNTISQSGGVLTGTDAVTAATSYSWTGGTQSGAGSTEIPTAASLNISGSATLDTRTLNNAGTASFTGGTLQLNNGAAFNNAGNFNPQNDTAISAGGAPTGTFTNSGNFARSGTGTTTTISAPFINAAGGTTQVNSGNLNFTGPVTNAGAVTASGAGSTLLFQNNALNNAGGTIDANNGAEVQLSGATVQGGSLSSSAGGIIRNFNDSTLSGVTITAGSTLNNPTGQTLHLSGTINNQGTISNSSTVPGSNTNIRISDGTTLTGTGTLTMSGPAAGLFGESTTDRLTNAAGHTIQGRGTISNMTLTNQGTINSNQNNPLNIDTANVPNAFLNEGTLQASNASSLRVLDTFTNSGIVSAQSGGTVNLDAAGAHIGTFNVAGILNAPNGLVSAGIGQTLNPTATMINVNGGILNVTGAISLFNLTGGAFNLLASNSRPLTMTGGSVNLNNGFFTLSNGSNAS